MTAPPTFSVHLMVFQDLSSQLDLLSCELNSTNMMKISSYILALVLILSIVPNISIYGQCTVSIPSSAIVVDVPTSQGGFDKHFWICDSLSHSGFDLFFYIEDGGYTSGSGIGLTSWVKDGGHYNSTAVDDTVYYENFTSILNVPEVAIYCPTITFDYSNAPLQGCPITQAPLAGIIASLDTVCSGNACIDFMDNSITNGTTTWNWSFPGGIPNASSDQNPSNICYATAGTYTAQLLVTDQIDSDTATYTIYVLVCTGIEDGPALNGFLIYPNPAKDRLLVVNPAQAGTVQFFDVTGRVVKSLAVTTGNSTVDVSDIPVGLYFVLLESFGKHSALQRLILE